MHATQRQRRPPLLRARAPARSARLDDVIGHVTTNYFRPTAVIDVRKACAQNQPINIRTAGTQTEQAAYARAEHIRHISYFPGTVTA